MVSSDFKDISEAGHKSLEALYRDSQVGRCVNSVTHDINNYLGAILAYTELVELETEMNDMSKRMMSQIIEGVSRCTELLSSLTEVARPPRPLSMLTDVTRLVDEAVLLRVYDMKTRHITIEKRHTENVPNLVTDRPSIKMALLYLLNNAMEALENENRKLIRVKTLVQNGAVEIEIWSSAPPIAEEHRSRLFEPFETTKNGSHMGLGLYSSQFIVRQHQGDLFYDPQRGFVMRLPFDTGLTAD